MSTNSLRVLITGTPCTGKTTIAERLAKIVDCKYVDVAKLIIDKKLYSEIDEKRGSIIVNLIRARKFFHKLVEENNRLVLDSHVIEIFPKELIDKVIVLRAHPFIIIKRGLDKGWSLSKCLENAHAELLGTCLVDAINFFGEEKVWQVNSTCRNVDDVVKEVLEVVKGKKSKTIIDWLGVLYERGEIELLLKLEKASYLPKDFFKLLSYCR